MSGFESASLSYPLAEVFIFYFSVKKSMAQIYAERKVHPRFQNVNFYLEHRHSGGR